MTNIRHRATRVWKGQAIISHPFPHQLSFWNWLCVSRLDIARQPCTYKISEVLAGLLFGMDNIKNDVVIYWFFECSSHSFSDNPFVIRLFMGARDPVRAHHMTNYNVRPYINGSRVFILINDIYEGDVDM